MRGVSRETYFLVIDLRATIAVMREIIEVIRSKLYKYSDLGVLYTVSKRKGLAEVSNKYQWYKEEKADTIMWLDHRGEILVSTSFLLMVAKQASTCSGITRGN